MRGNSFMDTNNLINIILVAIIAVTVLIIGIFFIGVDNSSDNPVILNNTTNATVNNTTSNGSVDSSSNSQSSSNSVSSSSESEAFDGDPDMIAQANHYKSTHNHESDDDNIVAHKYLSDGNAKVYYGDGRSEIVPTG